MLVVDPELTIRFATPTARKLFRIRESDVGRNVAEVAGSMRDPWLFDDLRAVTTIHGAVEREVRRDGVWRLRRAAPCRDLTGVCAGGAVVTSVAIDARRAADMALMAALRGVDCTVASEMVAAATLDALRMRARADRRALSASLLAALERAFLDQRGDAARREDREAALRISTLSPRQREVMERVADGAASKIVAFELGISQRTVENHRAAVMRKLGVRSAAALARLVCRAANSRFLPPRA